MIDNRHLILFKDLLLQTCGLSFATEREQTLTEALLRRMKLRGVETPVAYHALLIRDRVELLQLVELLTVNETYFFREPDCLKFMMDKLLPDFMGQQQKRPIRILSAGCSTGEEPYSIAMMLRDRYGAESERLFSITGVDIDNSAIASAKRGVYGKGSFRGMDQAVLERYFEPCGPGVQRINDNIKRQVQFEAVNLRGAFYPHGMHLPDFIFYRNVSIYFPEQVQHEIFGRLAGLLADGGYLFVGAAETLQHNIGLLSLVEEDSLFFFRKAPVLVFEERRSSNRHTAPSRTLPRGKPLTDIAPARGADSPPRHDGKPGMSPLRKSQSPPGSPKRDIGERFDTALELAQEHRSDEALGILEEIISQDGSFVKAHSLKASLLLTEARFEEARAVCEAILTLDQFCLEGYLMLGIIARNEGNEEEAFRRFRESGYLNSRCWPAHFYTAEIRFSQGDRKRAKKGYETALRILEEDAHEQAFFPLSFKPDQFIVICRHKLSLLQENG